MVDCLPTTKVNSAFYPSGVSINRVPACLAGVNAGRVHLCRMADNNVWQVTLRRSEINSLHTL